MIRMENERRKGEKEWVQGEGICWEMEEYTFVLCYITLLKN
jgi:hypothetical protein